jgi:tetrahydromethanopterin S-methyltransferase subunit E
MQLELGFASIFVYGFIIVELYYNLFVNVPVSYPVNLITLFFSIHVDTICEFFPGVKVRVN